MAVLSRRAPALPPLSRGLVAGVAVFLAALALLVFVHRDSGSGDRLSDRAAVAAALRDPPVRLALNRSGYTRYRVTPIDDRLVRVSFFDGPRIVFDAAVDPGGSVTNRIPYGERFIRVGSEIAQDAWILLLLSVAFVFAVARSPLEGRLNWDVAALIAFAAPVMLVNARFFEWSVAAAWPLLAYLGFRCLRVALGRPGPPEPSVPLFDEVTSGWHPKGRRRILVIAVAVAALALALVSIPGGLVSDVSFASMAGATDLIHGVLPYGHLRQSELVHGDTYPLLAYVLYIPAALIAPVKGAFDNLDGGLFAATAYALAGAVAMYVTGKRAAGRDDRSAGLRFALAWLAFPPVVIATSSGSNDMAAAACIAWAVALISYPGRSAFAVALAGWVKLAPLALLPAWILRERGAAAWRAAAAAVAVTAGVVALVLALGGPDGFGDMITALSFQAERGSLLSLWSLLDLPGLQVAFQAAVVTLIVVTAVRVWRDHDLATDPRRMAALGAAIMIGVQLAASYWTYTYLVWAFPLIALALLSERPARSPARA